MINVKIPILSELKSLRPKKPWFAEYGIDMSDLQTVEKIVGYLESVTDAEIVVNLVKDSAGYPGEYAERVKAHALAEFDRLGIQQTVGKTGLMVLLSMKERRVEILADKALNDISVDMWASMAMAITMGFKKGFPLIGLIKALLSLDGFLAQHCPRTHDGDELPNAVQIKG